MKSDYTAAFYKEYEQIYKKNGKLTEDFRNLKYNYQLLEKKNKTLENKKAELADYAQKQQEEISRLKFEVERLQGLLKRDGTNSGFPTSQTPIDKKKVIPNSRVKSGRKIGGQPGHPKAALEHFEESEVNIELSHELLQCCCCGSSSLEKTGVLTKDELDYRIVVEKKRHYFTVYRCGHCGKESHASIPAALKADNQYGPQVKALELSLMNLGNVPINRVKRIVSGLTGGEISPSQAYCVKLQERSARQLEEFCHEVSREILLQKVVCWDDTVIMVNTARACLRFYGTENLALYRSHLHKDKEGLDEDGILQLLGDGVTVMHDHNKINYNARYVYQNAECNAHLLRDLQKMTDTLGHSWSKRLGVLLAATNEKRTKMIEVGETQFTEEFQEDFMEKFDDTMIEAGRENLEDANRYHQEAERILITRILDYKNQYLAWVYDFDLPFTNNLSERSLRGAKSKMKVSGQFQNIGSARNYAAIKTYIETCYRNGINEYDALTTLCSGNPYTLKEILEELK